MLTPNAKMFTVIAGIFCYSLIHCLRDCSSLYSKYNTVKVIK